MRGLITPHTSATAGQNHSRRGIHFATIFKRMEATPYAIPMRNSWWANSTPEAEKENKPHHISLLGLQRPVPDLVNQPRGCGSQCTSLSGTEMGLEVQLNVDANMQI